MGSRIKTQWVCVTYQLKKRHPLPWASRIFTKQTRKMVEEGFLLKEENGSRIKTQMVCVN